MLSDAVGRQHFVERPMPDWEGFFDACGDDPMIDEMNALLALLDPSLAVLLVTARPARIHPLTEAWLRHYEVRWDVLVMRPWGSHASSRAYKRQTLADLREYGFDVRLAFEDDPRNVAMFRAEGLHCLYIHSGYYG